MPTLSRASSGNAAPSGYSYASGAPSPQFLTSLVSQASGVERARARFRSSVPSVSSSVDADDDGEDTASSMGGTPPPPRRASARTNGAPNPFLLNLQQQQQPSMSSSWEHLDATDVESEFAAAVEFVDSYQGPHRILTQENSAPKKEFYALYQQATVGPCPLSPVPREGVASKLEVARWEKWRKLGTMSRTDAMKRYMSTLDNLVEDWRRSVGVKTSTMAALFPSTSDAASAPSPSQRTMKRAPSVMERLPRIYDELGDLQERVEEETRRREDLETQLVASTRENRALFSREIQQVDAMRRNVTELVKSLEEDVALHYNEAQLMTQRFEEMRTIVEGSYVLGVERRVGRVVAVVKGWVGNTMVRRVLVLLAVFRVYRFLRQRQMPHVLAQFLIRCITSASAPNVAQPRTALTQS